MRSVKTLEPVAVRFWSFYPSDWPVDKKEVRYIWLLQNGENALPVIETDDQLIIPENATFGINISYNKFRLDFRQYLKKFEKPPKVIHISISDFEREALKSYLDVYSLLIAHPAFISEV